MDLHILIDTEIMISDHRTYVAILWSNTECSDLVSDEDEFEILVLLDDLDDILRDHWNNTINGGDNISRTNSSPFCYTPRECLNYDAAMSEESALESLSLRWQENRVRSLDRDDAHRLGAIDEESGKYAEC